MRVYKINTITFYLMSKFNYQKISCIPSLHVLISTVTHWGKLKLYYMLFFILILNILFFSSIIKPSRSKLSTKSSTFLIISRGYMQINYFLTSFIYFYLPLIDSSISEIYLKKITSNSIYFNLPKFPCINEIDLFMENIESLASFFNLTRINFILIFAFSRRKYDSLAFLNFLKFPILTV